jgi:hypothetical protein
MASASEITCSCCAEDVGGMRAISKQLQIAVCGETLRYFSLKLQGVRSPRWESTQLHDVNIDEKNQFNRFNLQQAVKNRSHFGGILETTFSFFCWGYSSKYKIIKLY